MLKRSEIKIYSCFRSSQFFCLLMHILYVFPIVFFCLLDLPLSSRSTNLTFIFSNIFVNVMYCLVTFFFSTKLFHFCSYLASFFIYGEFIIYNNSVLHFILKFSIDLSFITCIFILCRQD